MSEPCTRLCASRIACGRQLRSRTKLGRFLLHVVVALAVSGCLPRTEIARDIRLSCEAPPTGAGKSVRFEAIVLARTQNSLHVDFERFGADFSSITVEFRSPPEWAGLSAELHHQGEAVLDGFELAVGSSFGFIAVPPDRLHQPWFLHAPTR